MADRYLEHAISCLNRAKENPTDGVYCELSIVEVDTIIDLLKEQEAVELRVSSVEQRCGNCNKVIEMDGWQFCPLCGKRIDWKGWWKKNGTRN